VELGEGREIFECSYVISCHDDVIKASDDAVDETVGVVVNSFEYCRIRVV
jgi:hypothetical protein